MAKNTKICGYTAKEFFEYCRNAVEYTPFKEMVDKIEKYADIIYPHTYQVEQAEFPPVNFWHKDMTIRITDRKKAKKPVPS